jgi:hypothetical protein
MQVVYNRRANETYVLVPCGLSAPAADQLPAGAKVFEVPLVNASVTDTSIVAFMVSCMKLSSAQHAHPFASACIAQTTSWIARVQSNCRLQLKHAIQGLCMYTSCACSLLAHPPHHSGRMLPCFDAHTVICVQNSLGVLARIKNVTEYAVNSCMQSLGQYGEMLQHTYQHMASRDSADVPDAKRISTHAFSVYEQTLLMSPMQKGSPHMLSPCMSRKGLCRPGPFRQ